MVQFPKQQFGMLSMGLKVCGMAPYEYYPYLFMEEHVMCVIYVDACILFSKLQKYIDAHIEKMCNHKFKLKDEDQIITDLLGMDISNTGTGNDKNTMFVMFCHIDWHMALTGMNGCTPKDTISIQTLLGPYQGWSCSR